MRIQYNRNKFLMCPIIHKRIWHAAMASKQVQVARFKQFSFKPVLKCHKRISWTGVDTKRVPDCRSGWTKRSRCKWYSGWLLLKEKSWSWAQSSTHCRYAGSPDSRALYVTVASLKTDRCLIDSQWSWRCIDAWQIRALVTVGGNMLRRVRNCLSYYYCYCYCCMSVALTVHGACSTTCASWFCTRWSLSKLPSEVPYNRLLQ